MAVHIVMPSLVSVKQMGGPSVVLKDLYAFNVSLLASRSPIIHASGSFDALDPELAAPLHTSNLRISSHRNSAAMDFWNICQNTDGSLPALSNFSSSSLYRLIFDKTQVLGLHARTCLGVILGRRFGTTNQALISDLLSRLLLNRKSL